MSTDIERKGRRRVDSGDGGREVSRLQYSLLVEEVQEYAVFMMDPDGVIVHWGMGAERIKEFTPEEVLGKHLSFLYPEGGAEDGTAEEHLQAAREQGEYIGEGMRVARDRGLFPARVVLTALRHEGRLYGFSKVTQDLTERRRVEAALVEATRAAEAASREKSRFLATMSHEIRTPLNAILGYSDLLDMGVAGPIAPKQKGYLDRLRRSGHHLLALLEDVLDFAKIEADRLALERRSESMVATARAAVDLVLPHADGRRLDLSVECAAGDDSYWGDERRVRQILVNLLGNAVKFTAPGGRVVARCDRVEGPGPRGGSPARWTRVHVTDTGQGIGPEKLESVFEPFVQLDQELTRGHDGAGLGLAISRRLARLMGGELTVESRAEVGSTFTLWLPARPQDAHAEAEGDGRPDPLSGIARCLIMRVPEIAAVVVRRLRADPRVPLARERTVAELQDHIPTLLTDVAQSLMVLEYGGAEAGPVAEDGSELQGLLARRHGEQRRRLGWPRGAVEREYEILRAEVEATVRGFGEGIPERAREEALSVLNRLLGRAQVVSLEAFERAG